MEVKARKCLIDVASVCPATKSVVARQYKHVHSRVSAKAGEAVKRKGAVQGFVVEAGGKKFINEEVAECEMSEVAREAVASNKRVRAIGIEVLHKQAYIHEGHFGFNARVIIKRAEERGSFGGFCECRTSE